MNNLDVGHFVKGLKVFLTNTQTTQEEFAQGVTSKVNLSNVLRGNSGTSEKMRLALAKKAGLAVEDLVALGQGQGKQLDAATPLSQGTPAISTNYSTVVAMSAVEVLEKTAQINGDLLDAIRTHNKELAGIVSALTKQRDELINMLSSHRSTVNAIERAIVAVDRKHIVKDCNKAASEDMGVFTNAQFTLVPDVIDVVFKTGQKQGLAHEGREINLWPVFDHDNSSVKRVVVTIHIPHALEQ